MHLDPTHPTHHRPPLPTAHPSAAASAASHPQPPPDPIVLPPHQPASLSAHPIPAAPSASLDSPESPPGAVARHLRHPPASPTHLQPSQHPVAASAPAYPAS